jgi:hypothetical protein
MIDVDRRQVLRLGVLGLTLLGTSTGVAQLASARPAPQDDGSSFAEVYRGRRIRGLRVVLRGLPAPRVFVDDVELHLMRLDTGKYSTALNHYQTFGTPRLAARAAVDGLNGARLLPQHG